MRPLWSMYRPRKGLCLKYIFGGTARWYVEHKQRRFGAIRPSVLTAKYASGVGGTKVSLMPLSKVMAIDPGLSIGVATNWPGYNTCVFHDKYDLLTLIGNQLPDVVVVERFATGGRLSSYGLATIELVGIIQGYCFAKGIRFVTQTPSSRKAFMSDAKGLKITTGPHELDALAHLLEWEYRA